MTQTAIKRNVDLPENEWVLISEIDCLFQNITHRQVIVTCTVDDPPSATLVEGLILEPYMVISANDGLLARFEGVPGANRIYARSNNAEGKLFVSRAAVA